MLQRFLLSLFLFISPYVCAEESSSAKASPPTGKSGRWFKADSAPGRLCVEHQCTAVTSAESRNITLETLRVKKADFQVEYFLAISRL